ncbi:putative disease resistance RPP13-like protein 1 isoform X1 [Rosa rugosa]|uniref:putative disease resistance RPP13-like protein 1 isoform X1 n=1 Tax=Rosa rugosa TaxID=74645 RepID=UPI002B4050BA|nr:putative disease resistance RPP13-like protein 1 isoform X1 [Rosa rugosa]XP_061997385.1 putative disease resistance RPP13-like protein 1 isoform X1 [Rosa rugosa]XP_061997386.1 putative disease resistance RPP13-like protein 1 isoform X1 [Rosa rugosa]XP_061997387.1 putative disease resistance RPP13-like protein 1 isoform X1 [Rosa rugosa]XP_061997388.1 putative disease resistance RPP13-like protein 1 isoform X1 [Rosa rugosa]XP_061997389.1 putative disease resistance RPP13-like protein 1 isofor
MGSPSGFTYDVFLSFRGEDTRKNFTDHLHKTLLDARFRTFLDDDKLPRGENIKEELEKAIRESRSSVIVFSEDYASSKWCLDELVIILERRRTFNHFVLPVFYHVDPSHLRKQTGNVAEAFIEHQKTQSSEKLNGWRAALKQVADLAGMNLQDGHESEFIRKIVGEIHEKLGGVPLSDVQKELEEKLSYVDHVLNDAEGKQLERTVKPWLRKLKEAVYDAEDLLQEIKTEASRLRIEHDYGSSTSKVQELISTPSHAFDPALTCPRAEKVLERLDKITKQTKDVLASIVTAVSQTLPSTSWAGKSVSVCGRDEEKERLVKLLLSDDETGNEIGVILIVGMGGIGKTTLAQFLYSDPRVKRHFDIRAWVCVPKEFDVLKISQLIYESLTSEACQITNLDTLLSKLEKTWRGQRFFFVLDDIWNKIDNLLEFLMLHLESAAHGSKILITTRDENVVARRMCNLEAHRLMPMSEEDSWSLFEKHAFKNAGVGTHTHLEKIGRLIVRKCNGLPLAIKSLGALLCFKLLVEEWKSILSSDMWELSPDESDIVPSLWLSYLDLPLHLKRCFAYCSLYPKNFEFQKSELIYLWTAEDLLQHEKNKMAEEIGQGYFNDLISRSFFQLSLRSEKHFIMHDLFNDLASFVSGEFCFRWEGSDSPNDLSTTRHFSYKPSYYMVESLEMFEALQQAKCLRTFLTLDPWELDPWKKPFGRAHVASKGLYEALPKFQCLRMLKLSGYQIEKLPDSINNLKHLKHLDLSYSYIEKLPDTICTLYNLQVLLLSNCRGLTELPANLGRLINLSHLDITRTKINKMPPQMGKLKDLQMLPEFVVDTHTAGDNLVELKKLENLRGRLCISGLEHSSGLEAYILRDKKFLKELDLDWGRMPGWRRHVSEENNTTVEEREVLEKLQPHLNLERLRIERYGGKMFPGWSEYYFSSALVSLKLVYCKNCISLPPLGRLPFLRELCIEGLSGWQEWSDVGGDNNEGGVFPNLEKLEVEFCPNLTGRLASDSLPSLESLTVRNCPEFECFPEDGFPSKLKSLVIRDLKKVNAKSMQNLNKGLRTLTSLEQLKLDFVSSEKLDWFAEELFPSTLTSLDIFSLNCETIDGAKWFGHLNSLQDLRIWFCPALRCLPDSGLPSSLSFLGINQCPLLEKRCQRETGEDWPKIAHIKHIRINMVMI